ncbi:MAG: hypothetical protein MK237_07270 [Gemmatimonadetes bacterium]|jgi:magnesium-transporting ATPase (P-type)|nr:hypothetical protein [Gemmatimonadota bacterium]
MKIFENKVIGYFFLVIGIWFVLDSIRESRSEIGTDPGFWIGLLLILVWGRILVVVPKRGSIDQVHEKEPFGEEGISGHQEQEDYTYREPTQDEWDRLRKTED